MKKEERTRKSRDQVLWEDFVLKNNIKKRTSVSNKKLNNLKHVETFVKNENVTQYGTDIRSKLSLKNTVIKNHDNFSFRKNIIDVDKNKLRRIKSGKISIEGTLDLHGLSLKQAEKRLQIFVSESFRLKKRILLVITGKGLNSKPSIFGKTQTIKSEITKWISDSFYNDKVQYISKALDMHGGGGAYYFFLRKSENIFS